MMAMALVAAVHEEMHQGASQQKKIRECPEDMGLMLLPTH
jgi:hypothetical protein